MSGVFMVYLSTSKQVFQDQYQLIEEFVYVFAVLAFVIGEASFAIIFKRTFSGEIQWRKLSYFP